MQASFPVNLCLHILLMLTFGREGGKPEVQERNPQSIGGIDSTHMGLSYICICKLCDVI